MPTDNRIASDNPTAPRRRKERRQTYRYLLEDHPILGPVVTLAIGGLCLYATIFSSALRDVVLGADASRTLVSNFNQAMGWAVAFVIGIMAMSFLFLLVNGAEATYRLITRRPAVCPQCGLAEMPRQIRFVHEPVDGTAWEEITCPRCGNNWYAQR